ncbi:hypothetical protein BASA83_007114 [Batrachochytrium salamandrivorans]|nr:hypothetical protein BASA83_007114 [Batrachochytrium salamandrivorans]
MTPRYPNYKSAADPIPTVEKLRKNIKTITDEELQLDYRCLCQVVTSTFNTPSSVPFFGENQFTSSAGANEFGGQRAALKYLTTIYGENHRLPSEDSIISSSNPGLTQEHLYCRCPPESTNMGIIKLDSFDPKDVGTKSLAVLKAVMIVRSLLANELKDTKSVIYELRGNSGGDVDFADSMVQLFKPDFQPLWRSLSDDNNHSEHLC